MSRKPTPVGGAAAPADAPAAEQDAAPAHQEAEAAAPADAPAAAIEQPQAVSTDRVELRVLLDHDGHAVNDVIWLDAEDAMTAVLAGWADDDPAAIAAAHALAAE
ncbi:MAG: hypothetical protein QHC65_06420 [Sphingomonas sp.]|nr:hypothetical protein [Sphingomonas sp.]MDX3884037.1 hypothetical protein [Sphingomonas sp.]